MSIATVVFPSAFKKAVVTLLLKKTTLDANDINNYRPVSNLCFVSKIIEKVVAVRFSKHLTDNDLYEQMQFAYHPNHSRVSTAESTLDECIKGCHTSATRSIGSIQYDRSHNHVNPPQRSVWNNCNMSCIVWQTDVNVFKRKAEYQRNVQWCSVFHKVPFSALSCLFATLLHSVMSHGINVHLYDTQLYLTFSPHSEEDTIQAVTCIQDCVAELKEWMKINTLKFKGTKTEIIVMCAPHIKIKLSMPHI